MEKFKKYGPYAAVGLMLVVVFGYSLGKTLAQRDNARAAETSSEG